MEKQEQEPEHKKEQEQRHKEEQEQEQNQPNDHEQQHMHPNPDPPPKLNSPPREPEVRQANPSSLPKKGSPPREPEVRQANPSSLPKKPSPPREPELRQANPGSPPKKPSPPRLPYQNSTPKSPPFGEDDDEEEKEVKKPPSILPLPPAVAMAAVETKMEPTSQEVQDEENGLGGGVDAHGHGDGFVNTGSGRKFLKYNLSVLKKAKRDNMMNRALIVSRISGFVFSLVSFSILAADRDRGWAIDSFYRYKEFRYCLAVNIMAFVYSGFQGYDLIYKLNYGKRKEKQPVRQYIDFSLDQVITYLLISASSSAAVRIDDWQSNWGKDPFPDMARASVALSFLAFVALALSSLVSGYKVYTLKSS